MSSIAGRCALQEDLRLGEDYEEVRILAFDHRTGTWQLVVLDSEHGNAVVLGGHSITDGLEFVTTHQRAEGLLVDRVSLRRTREGWVMRTETAVGYGAPWRLLQEIVYTRSP